MSLQTAAEAVRQKGRGEDTMLIHMTPDEVKGLQALAMANGGSLTINPETGLPEAGFLKSLLPTLIGAGLSMIPGVGPLMAAGIVGGGTALATGDIGKGLMAGLGAYGGGNIGQALTGAGREVALQAASPEILQNTFTGNLGAAGSGLANIFSTDAAGTVARDAFIGQAADSAAGTAATGLGGGVGATKAALAATAGPLSQPVPVYTPETEESNYAGPYLPTERKVRYPTADRDPMDSSEFRYFDTVNPYPGFQTAPTSTPPPQNTYGPDAPRFAGIPVDMATDPARMRDYQQNPNLYSFAEGGAADAGTTAQVSMPPAGYQAGMEAEFDYGFRPMAADVPEIQQEAAVYNPVARERYGFTTGGDGPQTRSTGSTDMGYIPGIAAGIGRSYNSLPDFAKAVLPGAMTIGTIADREMQARGMSYNPLTGDYENRDYMDGGDAGYSTMSGGDGGGYDSYSDAGKAASDRGDTFFRAGGELAMDNGGFIVDAHTVSEIGNGSSDAGHEMLARIGGKPIKGPGDGTSDSIKANIGGVQEARVAKDESYLSRDDVKALGGGDLKKGEKMLYQLMAKAHESRKQKGRGQATGLDKLISRMA